MFTRAPEEWNDNDRNGMCCVSLWFARVVRNARLVSPNSFVRWNATGIEIQIKRLEFLCWFHFMRLSTPFEATLIGIPLERELLAFGVRSIIWATGLISLRLQLHFHPNGVTCSWIPKPVFTQFVQTFDNHQSEIVKWNMREYNSYILTVIQMTIAELTASHIVYNKTIQASTFVWFHSTILTYAHFDRCAPRRRSSLVTNSISSFVPQHGAVPLVALSI